MNEILGVDVSHYQGVMNWDLAKSRGVQFAIIKAGEGTSWRDPQFDRNVSECRRLGIKWGAYFYFYPQFDTMLQADNFINILMGHAPDIEIWGDFEQKSGVIDIASVQSRAQVFMNRINDFYRSGIYTSPDYAKSFLLNADWMKQYPLWIANYFVATPTIPPPWEAPTFWQFTSTYHGYGEDATATAIDANYWMGSADEWKDFAGIVTPPPVIVEPPPVIEPPIVIPPVVTTPDTDLTEIKAQVFALKAQVETLELLAGQVANMNGQVQSLELLYAAIKVKLESILAWFGSNVKGF